MAEKQNNKDAASRAPRPVIDPEECKGCGRCLAACPRKVLRFRARPNHRGVYPAEYTGAGCTGCGICFYTCPEPYAIQIETPDKRPPGL
jgi:NAD-dependent dihydropyrimidine dehydrogenase PreA subunit